MSLNEKLSCQHLFHLPFCEKTEKKIDVPKIEDNVYIVQSKVHLEDKLSMNRLDGKDNK